MEHNREQVIKAMECCTKDGRFNCDKCPFNLGDDDCRNLDRYALSLIKELTGKCCGFTAKELADKCEKLSEENERLRAERDTLESLVKDLRGRNKGLQRANESLAKDYELLEAELNECVQIKADTVQETLGMVKGIVEFDIALTEDETKYLLERINDIAEEMLGGETIE